MSNSLQLHGLYSLWNFPGQNSGVGSLSLLHGIFPIQGSNPGLPHHGRILYQLSHKWRSEGCSVKAYGRVGGYSSRALTLLCCLPFSGRRARGTSVWLPLEFLPSFRDEKDLPDLLHTWSETQILKWRSNSVLKIQVLGFFSIILI